MEITYLNTDFEIESTEDISRIVEEFGEDVRVLFHEKIRGHYCAGFEIAPVFLGADETLSHFCLLVEQLPRDVRRLWDGCVSRTVDVGFESGEKPPSFRAELRASTVRRVADIGCSIMITIYPSRGNDEDKSHS
jgi:hypothetical protein